MSNEMNLTSRQEDLQRYLTASTALASMGVGWSSGE